MGDVNYREKIENKGGVVIGHAYGTATDGVRITGSTTNVSTTEQDHGRSNNRSFSIHTTALCQVTLEEPLISQRC